MTGRNANSPRKPAAREREPTGANHTPRPRRLAPQERLRGVWSQPVAVIVFSALLATAFFLVSVELT